MQKKLIKDTEAAELLDVAVQTMRNWRFQGRAPKYIKLGRSIRYDIRDLEEFIEKRTVEAAVNE